MFSATIEELTGSHIRSPCQTRHSALSQFKKKKKIKASNMFLKIKKKKKKKKQYIPLEAGLSPN